jgi:tRNA-dihydrouridine synthase
MTTFWNDLPRPFFVLAPMEAVTDVVFRHVVAAAAPPDVWFTEFTNATGWVHAGQKAIGGRLVKTNDEQPIVAQIWGGEPGDMEQLARHCRELGYHGIDINMGCPAKSAVKSGGSALIRNPELAAQSIAAAKTAGLPVSVKTRLGYTHIDEWREWIAHILRQDIVNFTIHLRTKKEMSKVPAHYELIADIKKLRDEIAPQTLLTINGDIRDRQHGMELVKEYGVDGIMIGRGIFANPFAFAETVQKSDSIILAGDTTSEVQPENALTESVAFQARNGVSSENSRRSDLLKLLRLHLDLYDQYSPQTRRPYETLKRFYKIYIRDFDGASEIRDALMHTKSTDDVRALLRSHNL